VWFIDDNHADCINNAPKDVKFLTEQIVRLEREKQEMRLELQRHDCTYGDTPGLIHCSIDKPCTTHQLENYHKDVLGWAAQVGKIAAERAELRKEIERLKKEA